MAHELGAGLDEPLAQGIIPDIGIEVDSALRSNGIGLEEPPEGG